MIIGNPIVVSGGGGALKIQVNVETGSTVIAVKDGSTYNGVEVSTGVYEIEVPEYGTYTISAVKGGQTTSDTVTVDEETVNLSYAYVNGVCWDYSNSSTALTRLTYLNDPNHLVTTNITTEPVAAVGTGAGSSPMDTMMPWAGMEEYNVVNGAVGAKKGESGFSRTTKDTVVYIPEFYYKVIDDSTNSKRYWYVSDKAVTGFSLHPGSNKYIGKYETGASYVSKSGLAPIGSITRATARTNSKNKGTGWREIDFMTWCAAVLLYVVEFADWDSQAKVGQGVVSSEVQNTGGTDAMAYCTGRAAGTDSASAVQYRGIENLWGNKFGLTDGINFSNRKAYVCTTPANYADDTATNYTDTGVTLPSGTTYIKGLGYSSSFPWAFIPNSSGGGGGTYIPDYVTSSSGWCVFGTGGDASRDSMCGILCFWAGNASSTAGSSSGARLLFDPS